MRKCYPAAGVGAPDVVKATCPVRGALGGIPLLRGSMDAVLRLQSLQTIFQDAFPAYEQRHALPAHVRRAAHALMQCRTAALGGHIQACPDGHVSRIWYNSCRHRSCPQCAYLQSECWLARQRARLLACDHYHVIFTLPHELNPLWLANVSVMTTLLFQAARDTLFDLLAAPEY